MFIRRIYYNSQGEVLHSYMMEGALKPRTAEDEATLLGLEDWNVIEWIIPNPEIEQNFIDSYGRVSVDVTGEEPTLIFDFSPLPEPEPTVHEQYYNAVSAELEG